MKCPLCEKEYQGEKALNRHTKKYHGKRLVDIYYPISPRTIEMIQGLKDIFDGGGD